MVFLPASHCEQNHIVSWPNTIKLMWACIPDQGIDIALQANTPNVIAFKESLYLSTFRCYLVRLGPGCQYPFHNLEMTPSRGPHQGRDTILQWESSNRPSWPSTLVQKCNVVNEGKSSSMNVTLAKFEPIFLIALVMGCFSQVNCSK